MKKFRRWLIHKLGGVYKDDFVKLILNTQDNKIQISNTQDNKIQKIHSEFTTTFYHIPKEEVKRILLDGIYKELFNYDFKIKKQELNMCDVYSMELEFVLQKDKSE